MPSRGSQRRAARYAELARRKRSAQPKAAARPVAPPPSPRAAAARPGAEVQPAQPSPRARAPSRSQGTVMQFPDIMTDLRRIAVIGGSLVLLLLVGSRFVG